MDIQVSRLRELLGLVKPVISRNPALPALNYVYLGEGDMVATDLNTTVIVPVPEVKEPVLLPYAEMLKTYQYVQGGESLHIEQDDKTLKLSWSDGETSLATLPVTDFPPTAAFTPAVTGELNSDSLVGAMMDVLSYAAAEDARPVLHGVTVNMNETFYVAAGDGYRLAYKVLPLSYPELKTVIFSTSAVIIFAHIWGKTPRIPRGADNLVSNLLAPKPVHLAFDENNNVRFVFNGMATIITKPIEGTPPSFLELVPQGEPEFKTHVMANSLDVAVRRARGIAGGDTPIRLVFDDEKVTVSAKEESREIKSTVKTINTTGAPNRIAVSAFALTNYLRGKDGLVKLAWHAKGSPINLNCQNTPNVLIMPIHVHWEDEPEAEDAPVPGDTASQENQPADGDVAPQEDPALDSDTNPPEDQVQDNRTDDTEDQTEAVTDMQSQEKETDPKNKDKPSKSRTKKNQALQSEKSSPVAPLPEKEGQGTKPKQKRQKTKV